MILRTAIAFLLILFVQTPQDRTAGRQGGLDACQAENKRLSAQVQTLNERLAILNRQLTSAKQEVDKYRETAQGKGANDAQFSALQKRLNDASQQLATCQKESARLESLNGDLRKQLNDQKTSRDQSNLDRQLAEAKQEVERCQGLNLDLTNQLKDLRAKQANFDLQLLDSKKLAQKYESQNAQLSNQMQSLQQQVSGYDQQLKTTNEELKVSKASVADLTKQVVAKGNAPANPLGVLELAKSSQEQAIQSGTAAALVYEDGGKVHVVRELVIGTLQTIFEKETKPGVEFPLKAIFKPHPIITPGALKASEEPISWFIDLQYPSQHSSVSYDEAQSGQKPTKRAIDPAGGEETWVWKVTPPANFGADVSDLVVFAEYKMAEQTGRKDIVHENIKFTQIKEPGTFTQVFAWVKENLSYLLATLSVAIGIWATIIKTKKDKLELRLKEKEQAQEP
jgi:hypothetical protein